MSATSFAEYAAVTARPKLSFSDLITVKGLKDPAKPARPMRITPAMVERAGKERRYPSTYKVFDGLNSTTYQFAVKEVTLTEDDGSISILFHGAVSSPEITSAYVAEFCKLNYLRMPE